MASNASSPPVIGITTYLEQTRFGVWDVPAAVLQRGYLDGVVAAGGVPVLLPPVDGMNANVLSRVDGLLVAGGADIDPVHYGAARNPATGPARPDRDIAEHTLIEAALANGVPVLGVCRGMQLLNVVLGGTLHQHIPDTFGGTEHLPKPGTFGRVPVKTAPGSRLAAIVGSEVDVHCHHHQSIDLLAAGLVPVAWAGDGVVEAIELAGPDFVLAVQWHPEGDGMSAGNRPANAERERGHVMDHRLFQALVEASTR
ncbi:gamma-glutamyl-gamma-aminobutyrate hydrolase family protein [Actinophytocola oryzae]|uniref:Putative glutamine amidotransferase n=1 Tax=Actinophytocola oryzae TaxID=502181 RepID=A0A4R7UQE1_9PSEU|nr:gamma-glutamyl-gamma-aminobutyrate hydrolase family protein [Actinophytocola oryzae]TDV36643.1 putative glutamine amidotransferase [Actinophytocola oryzae]